MTLPKKFTFRLKYFYDDHLFTAERHGEVYKLTIDDDTEYDGEYQVKYVQQCVDNESWVFIEDVTPTQAQKNGWPDVLPDMFSFSHEGRVYIYNKLENTLINPGGGVITGYIESCFDGMEEIWTFVENLSANKPKSEAEFHIEEAIRYHESQIEHHNLMIGKYKEKLGG